MLREMIGRRPQDPFPRYALALEQRKLGQLEEAWSTFEGLMAEHPSYLPSYLMAGTLLGELERGGDALSVLARGVEVARAAGDDHTLGELRSAMAGFE